MAAYKYTQITAQPNYVVVAARINAPDPAIETSPSSTTTSNPVLVTYPSVPTPHNSVPSTSTFQVLPTFQSSQQLLEG